MPTLQISEVRIKRKGCYSMYEYTSSTGENGADYFGIVLPKDVVEIIGLDIRVTDKFVDIDTGNVGFTLEYCNSNDPPTVVKTSGSTLVADLNSKAISPPRRMPSTSLSTFSASSNSFLPEMSITIWGGV